MVSATLYLCVVKVARVLALMVMYCCAHLCWSRARWMPRVSFFPFKPAVSIQFAWHLFFCHVSLLCFAWSDTISVPISFPSVVNYKSTFSGTFISFIWSTCRAATVCPLWIKVGGEDMVRAHGNHLQGLALWIFRDRVDFVVSPCIVTLGLHL